MCVAYLSVHTHFKNCALVWKMLNLCHMWRAQLHSCSDLRYRPILPDWKLCSRPVKWADMWHAHPLCPRSCFLVAVGFLLFEWDNFFKLFARCYPLIYFLPHGYWIISYNSIVLIEKKKGSNNAVITWKWCTQIETQCQLKISTHLKVCRHSIFIKLKSWENNPLHK